MYVIRKFQRGKKFFSLHSLGEKMVAAYENSKMGINLLNGNDMHCAVNIPDKNQWRRGQIIRMVMRHMIGRGKMQS